MWLNALGVRLFHVYFWGVIISWWASLKTLETEIYYVVWIPKALKANYAQKFVANCATKIVFIKSRGRAIETKHISDDI